MNYEAGITDSEINASLKDHKTAIVSFALKQLQDHQPRDDYREFLELCIVFLGEVPPRGVRFLAPGPVHHARWMAKALYSLKIWLFQCQFDLTAREKRGLRDVCIFIVKVYMQSWFTAPAAVSAPSNDLTLIKTLYNYKNDNSVVGEVAAQKFSWHLWYLSEQLVCLAFYDENISSESKRAMVRALQQNTSSTGEPAKRFQLNTDQPQTLQIEHFITSKTCLLYTSDAADE